MSGRFAGWTTILRRIQPEHGRIDVASWWTVALLPVLLLVAIAVPYNILYHITYLWAWLLAVSWAWVRYQGPRVDLRRELRTNWAQVGDELEEYWELYNAGALPVLWAEVSDTSTVPGYNARRVAAATPGGFEHWITSAVCRRRGRYRIGPLVLEMSDPLGLFRYRRVDATTREMIIYPPLVQLPGLDRPRGQRGGVARASLLNILPTTMVGGLRDYRPGDPLSYIHWRAVAHTGKLIVKEFDQEIAGAVWIVLDLARAVQSGSGDEATEELGVVLACSLANAMLAEGRTVGLLAHGAERRIVRPARGRQHLWEVMSTLVDAQANGELPLHQVLDELASLVPSRPATVVITPDRSGTWAARLANLTGAGASALALLVEAPNTAAATATGQLVTLGIRHATFRAGDHLPLLTPERKRQGGFRISPLGRAIKVEQ